MKLNVNICIYQGGHGVRKLGNKQKLTENRTRILAIEPIDIDQAKTKSCKLPGILLFLANILSEQQQLFFCSIIEFKCEKRKLLYII